MTYITRKQWGARPPKQVTRMPRPVRLVYVHHTAGPVGGDPAATVRAVQAQHMDRQGWSDIAYQELVAPDGTVFEGRGFDVQGGATQGRNSTSLAICALGNYDVTTVPAPILDAIAARIAAAARGGFLAGGFVIAGHRDANATACPGRNLYDALPAIRRRVADLLAPAPVTPEGSMAETVHIKFHPHIVKDEENGGRSWPSTEALAYAGRLMPLTNPAPVLDTFPADREHDLSADLSGSRAVIDAFRNAV
jgi:peptidoglycan recognition protein